MSNLIQVAVPVELSDYWSGRKRKGLQLKTPKELREEIGEDVEFISISVSSYVSRFMQEYDRRFRIFPVPRAVNRNSGWRGMQTDKQGFVDRDIFRAKVREVANQGRENLEAREVRKARQDRREQFCKWINETYPELTIDRCGLDSASFYFQASTELTRVLLERGFIEKIIRACQGQYRIRTLPLPEESIKALNELLVGEL